MASLVTTTVDGTLTMEAGVGGVDQTLSATSTNSLVLKNTGHATNGGLVLQGSGGGFGIQLYWSTTTYGFLDGAWASWDIKKVLNGAFSVDEGSGLKRVLTEAGGTFNGQVTINQDANNYALYIDSESASYESISVRAKWGMYISQDIGGGYGMYIARNLNEAGAYALVSINSDHTASTQPALWVNQDGAGYGIQLTQGGAQVGLLITQTGASNAIKLDQNGNGSALYIDSESTTTNTIESYGKYGLYHSCDISGGYGLYIYRNLNEAGASSLAHFIDDHTAGSQTTVYIRHDSSSGLALDCVGAGRFSGAVTTAALTAATGSFAGHVTPASNISYNLGSSGARWLGIYGNTANFSGAVATGAITCSTITTSSTITANGHVTIGNTLKIYSDDTSTDPGIPYMRSNGNYLVIEADPNHEMYLQNDGTGDLYLCGGGGNVYLPAASSDLIMDGSAYVRNANNNAILLGKGTRWGYSTAYKAIQIGDASGSYTVCIGYDPAGNANGSFTGDGGEILFRNDMSFMTPNAADNGWHNCLHFKDGKVGIGDTTPDYKLDVDGTFRCTGTAATGALTCSTIQASSTITGALNGTLGATTPSSVVGTVGLFNNSLTCSTASAITGSFNSTHANGGFIEFERSGVVKGYLGSAAQLLTGGADDIELRSNARLALTPVGALELWAGEAKRVTVTSGGNVGIGEAAPGAKLTVAGNAIITSSNPLYMGGNATAISSWVSQQFASGQNHYLYCNGFVVSNVGYVSPATNFLQITSTGQAIFKSIVNNHNYHYIDTTSGGYNPILGFLEAGTRRAYINYVSADNYLSITTEEASSDIAIMAASDKVGVGTTAPAHLLDVDGGSAETRLRISTTGVNTNEAGIILANSSKSASNDGIAIAHGGGQTQFANLAGTQMMMIDVTNARVVIGTGAASYKLDVNGTFRAQGAATFSSSVTASSFSGNGASISALNALNISAGTVATARLGSGTANSSVFLRGDSTWATPSNTTYSAGTGLTLSSTTFSTKLDELTDMTADVVGSQDELILLDNGSDRRKQINEIKLGQFNNDQGWTSNAGDITSVGAGVGLSGGGTSGGVTLTVDLDELATAVSDPIGNDYFVYVTQAGASKKYTINDTPLSKFDNDSGWITSNWQSLPNVSSLTALP